MSAVVVVFAAAAAADVGALIENARMQKSFLCDAIFENFSRERERSMSDVRMSMVDRKGVIIIVHNSF